MRVLVCGGRNYRDHNRVYESLDSLHRAYGFTHLIHGAAPGADRLAATWATERWIHATAYPADWKAHGRAAGPIRNRKMLTDGKPELVVAFPGGTGTANMLEQAQKAGIQVIKVIEP